jgi:CheY-like chemotaxis protein
VLVVEDNEVNRQVVVATLEALDCKVDAVENGQEAVDRFDQMSSYDLIFMDCQMPIMDGFTATRGIRAREAEATGSGRARIPIIALTAHAMASDRQECFAAGMDDYLTKPFTKADLKGGIERALEGYSAAAPESGQEAAKPKIEDAPKARSRSALPEPGASVDSNVLRRLASTQEGSGSVLVTRVVDAYLESSAKMLAEMRDAASEGAPAALASAAATLGARSAQVGAMGLSNMCKEIEALCREGTADTGAAAPLLDQVGPELESVHEQLVAEGFGAGGD